MILCLVVLEFVDRCYQLAQPGLPPTPSIFAMAAWIRLRQGTLFVNERSEADREKSSKSTRNTGGREEEGHSDSTPSACTSCSVNEHMYIRTHS